MEIKTVSVIGGGLMGRQIALNNAKYGFMSYLTDVSEDVCENAKAWAEEYLAGRIAKGRMTEEEVATLPQQEEPTEEPTLEERLAALESAMLEQLLGSEVQTNG